MYIYTYHTTTSHYNNYGYCIRSKCASLKKKIISFPEDAQTKNCSQKLC